MDLSQEEYTHLREQEKKMVKFIITNILEQIKKLTDEQKQVERLIDLHKLDLRDFKFGRLDRIVERQRMDPFARQHSVVVLEEMKRPGNTKTWYRPYACNFNKVVENPEQAGMKTIHSSMAKDFSVGSYKIGEDKEIIHLK